MLIENRVKKLKLEEERLQKQIRIANKHSMLADAARERKEADERLKAQMMREEMERIEKQNRINHERKNQNLHNIKSHQSQIQNTHDDTRGSLSDFLKTNYTKHFEEKRAFLDEREGKTSDMYTAYKNYLNKRDNNKAQNYANTTGQNDNQRDDHIARKKQTEQRIQQLEQEEMQMLNSMQ